MSNPESQVNLTFFEYIDKINELAIKFRLEKKQKQKDDYSHPR